ncbi:hypothetical protein [Alienimonas californiensis]|uniref:Uncharacterized protein n=1 Tax=Alienimonas californiensis TaxID=2527989 RepID=A0A517PBF7_9PLAN|nr:hypothetical protein [Alienimonas californiensis]QDT16715.1 hypothetical protein CA12_28210 [Alienimonas californiensis]
MTSRSFALSSLVAAIPGAAVATFIVMAILEHSGEIFASIPLAASLIVALICGVIVTLAPIVIFFRGGKPAQARAVGGPLPMGGSGEVYVAEGSSDELGAAESSAILAAAGTSNEILVDDEGESGIDEFDDDDAFGDSAEFVEAGSAEFDAEDEDSFSDFDDDADDNDGDHDSFFDQPSQK